MLVPGGPIETRDFSQINPVILGIFNTFLTFTGILSILLMYFVFRNKRWVYMLASLCGFAYVSVYGLDLTGIFPVSPSPMPVALLVIERLGAVVALVLTALSLSSFMRTASSTTHSRVAPYARTLVYLTLFLVLFGIGIIVFATKAAMGK